MDAERRKELRDDVRYGNFANRTDVLELLDALEAAETELETEEQLGVIYREQLAGVPGDTPQQQIEWLLERAGVATKEA